MTEPDQPQPEPTEAMAKTKEFIIGVDIGGTKILAAVMTPDFKVLGRNRKKTRSKKPDGKSIFDRLVDCVAGAVDDAGVDAKGLLGIGVGSPGPLDPATGVIIDTPNLEWKKFPLAAKLSKAFGGVPVAVDNDVNMGIYGELNFGAAKGGRNVIGIFPGTGIGGGLVIEGELYRGASGAAGEFGHMIADPGGYKCGCGRIGCLEAYAGRTAIAGRLAALVLRGQAPNLAKDIGSSDLKDIRSGAIARAVAAGDKEVEAVIRDEARRIGVMIASVVNLLSPDTIVLGGGLVEAMEKLFVGEVEGAIKQYALPFLARFVKVVPAKLGDDAAMMGAAQLIADRLAGKGPSAEQGKSGSKSKSKSGKKS